MFNNLFLQNRKKMAHLIKVLNYNDEYVLTPTSDAKLIYSVLCYRIANYDMITLYTMEHSSYDDAYVDALEALTRLSKYKDIKCSLTIKYDKYREFQ